jgi:hypothetical protein
MLDPTPRRLTGVGIPFAVVHDFVYKSMNLWFLKGKYRCSAGPS